MAAMMAVPMDVSESEDSYDIHVSLPGANPDDIEITMNNNTLTIRGEVSSDEEREEHTYHIRERRFGSFVRSITLPSNVNVDQVDTNYDNGVLHIRLPKAEEARPKRIQVGAARGGTRAKTSGQRQMSERATTGQGQSSETRTRRTR
jgi:HSP20 family protein